MATSVGMSQLTSAQTVPDAATRERVTALLARMTLDEKIGQMTQLTVQAVASSKQEPGRIALDQAKLQRAIVDRHVGSIINVLDVALPLSAWQSLITQIQDVATKRTRLSIPVLYGIDFVHGANYLREGTIFPHNIGLAATFDRDLAERTGEVTARQAAAAGLFWNFAPVLDVGRQPAWPRFYETFGEDPLVAAQLGAANLIGMRVGSNRVASTMKHYLAYGMPQSGRDRTPADLSEREIREHALPPFRAAVRAGAKTVMVNSAEIDGVPVHASHHWLTDVLRGELGFNGVIVTDWEDIVFLHSRHHVAATMRDAVRMAIQAGVDMSMTPYDFDFADTLKALVNDGVIPVSRIDESVRRILTVKAEIGLLDSAYPDPTAAASVSNASSQSIARRAARESITLLKNERQLLPIAPDAKVLVTGPAAASVSAQYGGWSYTWQGSDATKYPAGARRLIDGIKQHSSKVTHVPIASFSTITDAELSTAVAAARGADVAIVALGEEGYAEWIGNIGDLTLPEPQLKLAAAIAATGTPTVVVLLEGRPRIITPIAEAAQAIVLGYWPGAEGGDAMAEVLFGDVNPSGKLPFTYPRSPNALAPYDHRYTETLNTGFERAEGGFDPLFEFGRGLSYTTFSYHDLTLDRSSLGPSDSLHVRVTVTNTGKRAGAESVLLFTRQHYASITPPVRRLRAFERVQLEPGASQVVQFTLAANDLAFIGRDLQPSLEPGAFDVMVGALKAEFSVVQP